MKKGQMEILGLAIIIMLVSIGMLLIVRFVVLAPTNSIKATYTDTEIASNIINAMLKTNTQCRNQDLTELWQDCVTYKSLCDVDQGDTCRYAGEVMDTIFNRTLVNWSKRFSVQATLAGQEWYSKANGECTRNMDRQSKTFTVPTDSGDLNIKLNLCK